MVDLLGILRPSPSGKGDRREAVVEEGHCERVRLVIYAF